MCENFSAQQPMTSHCFLYNTFVQNNFTVFVSFKLKVKILRLMWENTIFFKNHVFIDVNVKFISILVYSCAEGWWQSQEKRKREEFRWWKGFGQKWIK